MGCSSSNVNQVEEMVCEVPVNKKSVYYTFKGENISKINEDDGPSQKIELICFLKKVEKGVIVFFF